MPEAPRTVSVIVPCRNERGFIEAFCASVAAQRLPEGVVLQVFIADGDSDDGTREWLEALVVRDPRFVVIANPKRIVSPGLNAAIAQSRGEVIVRMDVHTTYADDYVAQCLGTLARTGADNVGGPWKAQGDGDPIQPAIAAAFQSRWLAGGARSRQIDYDGEVDTVYLGAWPRATFERFGGFDETLVRNQDDEHNLRIVRGGGRVWQSASIRSTYRPRGSLTALFRQYLQYGYWKPFVMKKHGQAAAMRHLVPAAFVALLVLLLLSVPLGASIVWAASLFGLYVLATLGASVSIAAGASWSLLPRLPLVIAAYHFGYGIGSLIGWWDVLRGVSVGRARLGSLTR
jgi:succinoglycan biosynthesis protein ExoA